MPDERPTVVIVGAGFGGLRAARRLRRAAVRVILLDRRNHHLFQPLLYQVATAGLEPEQIAKPVRAILRGQANLEFRMAEVRSVDLASRIVRTSAGDVPYRYLILAVGAETDYFGKQGVIRYGHGLKDLNDAVAIRNCVLRRFEEAALEDDPIKRRAMLGLVVVGGGPTGVEMAGAMAELVHLVLVKDYPRLNPDEVQILLVEAGDRLLPGMPPELSRAAAAHLERKRVRVRLGTLVEDYDGEGVSFQGGERIEAKTLIWAAGARAAPLVRSLGLPTARHGRLPVALTLQLPGVPEAYLIGDAAYLEGDGQPLPMMAPVAMQMADTAVENIVRQLEGRSATVFRYRSPGSLATIGRNAAVAHVHGVSFRGFAAWVVWLVVHLIQLIGFRNRLFVLVNWAVDYFLYDRAVRLITPTQQEPC